MIKFLKKNEYLPGYVTLLSVLVLGAISTAITVSLIILGLSSSATSFSYQKLNQAKSLANACAEEALQEIRNESSFSGSGNLNLGQGSCSYLVTITGADSRLIQASGTVGETVRKVTVTITAINPLIIISSWQEI